MKIHQIFTKVANNPTQKAPYCPIMMRTKPVEIITEHEVALRATIEDSGMTYCKARAVGNESALNTCLKFHKTAINYGMTLFENIFKY